MTSTDRIPLIGQSVVSLSKSRKGLLPFLKPGNDRNGFIETNIVVFVSHTDVVTGLSDALL